MASQCCLGTTCRQHNLYLHSQLASDKVCQVQQVIHALLKDSWDIACSNALLHHLHITAAHWM